jgi:hypothetical protein
VALLERIGELADRPLTAVALVHGEERRALGLVRAGLLTVTPSEDNTQIAELRSAVIPEGDATRLPVEAVVVIARPPEGNQ